MDWFSDSMEHKKLENELFTSDWFKGLMESEEFRRAYEKNYSVRLKMADTNYLKELLTSELARMDFVETVFTQNQNQKNNKIDINHNG